MIFNHTFQTQQTRLPGFTHRRVTVRSPEFGVSLPLTSLSGSNEYAVLHTVLLSSLPDLSSPSHQKKLASPNLSLAVSPTAHLIRPSTPPPPPILAHSPDCQTKQGTWLLLTERLIDKVDVAGPHKVVLWCMMAHPPQKMSFRFDLYCGICAKTLEAQPKLLCLGPYSANIQSSLSCRISVWS